MTKKLVVSVLICGDPIAGGLARPGLRTLGPAQPAGSACCSHGGRADRVAHGLGDPNAFCHSIANGRSNRKPGANANPDAIVFAGSITIANRSHIAHFVADADSELILVTSPAPLGAQSQVVP
jgi:hypothetical protein